MTGDASTRSGRRLRILFVVHSRWVANAGLPHVHMELMRQFERMGHHCEKFSKEDAFPRGLGWFGNLFTIALFQRAVLRHVRKHAHRFDLIHAEHHVIPYRRERYRYPGWLVVKSQGLIHFYVDYMRTGPLGAEGKLLGRMLRRLAWWARLGVKSADRAFEAADQIYLMNSDELAFVRDELGHGSKCFLVNNGLRGERRAARAASCPAERRVTSDTVAFVGVWSPRKGSVELPGIVRAVRERRPATRFRLLGTGCEEDVVLRCLAPQDRDSVEVVPRFEHDELPALLADARAGVVPSHVESFGLGLLEMVAAGIPVVGWDASGPRDIVKWVPTLVLVPIGDGERTAAELLRLLECGEREYVELSKAGVEACGRFTWERVARLMDEITLQPLMERRP